MYTVVLADGEAVPLVWGSPRGIPHFSLLCCDLMNTGLAGVACRRSQQMTLLGGAPCEWGGQGMPRKSGWGL